ncbi:MAG TPA: hypothetical protein VFG20_21200 [Planctomycetaceae bacterium]|nr:hypothetical protein [Planctomycetaceae bacterium]
MTISIVTCPKCGALVLGDTPECYACHHVLHTDAPAVGTSTLPTDAAVADDLEVCAACGETYRKGLVRCWSCGAFTRQEIADAYQNMLATQASRPVAERAYVTNAAAHEANPFTPDELMNRQSEFIPQDGPEYEVAATDEDFDFELADSVALGEAGPPISEDDAYKLVTSTEPAPPPPPPIPEATEVPESAIPSLPVAEDQTAESIPATVETGTAKSETIADAPKHSEATAGDALLDIAKSEEADIAKVKKDYRNKVRNTFLVFCPMGCKIRVPEKHRGKSGKCPRCGSVYVVPLKKKEAAKTEEAAPVVVESKWKGWQDDVHLHSVHPTKLRIKADSLVNEFTEVDVGFSDEGMLQVTLVTAAGMFGANLKKKPALRAAVREHLKTAGKMDGLPAKIEGLPAPTHRLIPTEALTQVVVVQPCPPDVESLFGNIPVFGANRIAVRASKALEDGSTPYYSFNLSQFRAFAKALAESCGVTGLGANTEIPLTEEYKTYKCHYTEQPVRELQSLAWY